MRQALPFTDLLGTHFAEEKVLWLAMTIISPSRHYPTFDRQKTVFTINKPTVS